MGELMSNEEPAIGRVTVFDTTLRDGEQSPGCSMTVREKTQLARKLVELGVDILEAGFPIASDGDFEAVELRQAIEHAMHCLNPRLRQLIELRYFNDHSQSDVARAFGISQMQVSRLERQALDQLRGHLHSALE